ncbi:MAG: amino acid transporter substrate-binding protein [Actinomycetia bacterium]|jgi:polar amino acid transport system substrate-binding protein|nr:amino acid transporter substrate-binding protein [Actinomycetes bacterium]
MRRWFLALAVLALTAGACAEETSPSDGETPTEAPEEDQTAAECTDEQQGDLFAPDTLTIGTGNPAYKPWYGGESEPGSDWRAEDFTGDPHSGEGYESAFAYALAEEMGFSDDQVEWVAVTFNKSFAPGPKDFDFAMQQISISAKREEAVDFSAGYFDVNQALIANEGSPAIGVTTLAGLKDLKLGAPIGTTSLQAIEELVQPTQEAAAYDDLDLALKDLKNGQLDGVVVDFPTAFYGYADVVVGQFPDIGGEQEQFGLAFETDSSLVRCANIAIEAMRDDGRLDALKSEWLEVDTSVPVFS